MFKIQNKKNYMYIIQNKLTKCAYEIVVIGKQSTNVCFTNIAFI